MKIQVPCPHCGKQIEVYVRYEFKLKELRYALNVKVKKLEPQ